MFSKVINSITAVSGFHVWNPLSFGGVKEPFIYHSLYLGLAKNNYFILDSMKK
jgi:hypothetical protein